MDLDIRAWGIVTWILTLVGAAGALVFQTKSNTKKIETLEHGLNKKLFKDDGESIYVTRRACDNCKAKCQMSRNEAYQDLKEANKELKDDMKELKKELTEEMKKVVGCLHELSGAMDAIKQFMKTQGD